MSEKSKKRGRSRAMWTDIELRLLNDVIARDELLKRIWKAYQSGELSALMAAMDDIGVMLGPKLKQGDEK